MSNDDNSDKVKLLYKIDNLKRCGYFIKNLSINDSYEEIKYEYELAKIKIKKELEDNLFEQFVDDINNKKYIQLTILSYLYIADQDTLKTRLKRINDNPNLSAKIMSHFK